MQISVMNGAQAHEQHVFVYDISFQRGNIKGQGEHREGLFQL